ncbi:MAG: cytochrome c1, partial [Pseudomonadales bacterium]
IALENLVFTDQKIGELMTISMPKENAKEAFGVAPPDLTLVARARGSEWLYTYLKNFYADDSRPMGVNNRVFADVGMPHALLELQGLQTCVQGDQSDEHAGSDCASLEITQGNEGQMTPEEFDQVAYDLTNFLVYMAEPMAEERKQIGAGVLIFLSIFFVLAWLLNREYWRNLH